MVQPKDMLPDDKDTFETGGVAVRKGSVAAFMANVRVLQSAEASEAEKATAKSDIEALLPSLEAVGVFDVFELKDPEVRALVSRYRS